MSEKRRSINTRFWEDDFIEQLTVQEKLLFLYLLTNPQTNLIGIYTVSLRRIQFETGLNEETIRNAFKRFANHSKAFFLDDKYVILPNWLKNQRMNPNMKKAAKNEFDQIPKDLIIKVEKIFGKPLGNGLEWLDNHLEWLGEIEREIEREIEEEEEGKNVNNKKSIRKKNIIIPTLKQMEAYFNEKGYSKQHAKKVFDYYTEGGWKDSEGRPVISWKQKCISVWFKDEGKIQEEKKRPFMNFEPQ